MEHKSDKSTSCYLVNLCSTDIFFFFFICLFRSTMRWSVTCWTHPQASWTWEKTQKEWFRLLASQRCLPSTHKRSDKPANHAWHNFSFVPIKTFRLNPAQLDHTWQRTPPVCFQIMELLMKGNKQRTQEPTAANQTSSRSHAVLQVAVKQQSRCRDVLQEVRFARLFMIDLAGSERAAQVCVSVGRC